MRACPGRVVTAFFRKHPGIIWSVSALAGILLLLVVAVSVLDWNALRPWVARRITAATGRPASIGGDLKVHLWSWNPTAEVNDLRIQNPDWAARDIMFGAKQITVSVSLGRLLRGQIGRASCRERVCVPV